MPRPAETPGKPATRIVNFRANNQMVAWLDEHKGRQSRGAFIRALVRAEAKRRRSNEVRWEEER